MVTYYIQPIGAGLTIVCSTDDILLMNCGLHVLWNFWNKEPFKDVLQ